MGTEVFELVDEGRFSGGFPRLYDAAIVERDPAFIEIRAQVVGARSWCRSFPRTKFDPARTDDCLYTTPNPHGLGLCISGLGFAVDVRGLREFLDLDITPLECLTSDVSGRRLFLADFLSVHAFDGSRVVWTSRRVSLDGISDLTYADGVVTGVARELGDEASPFVIDAATGHATGGFKGWDAYIVGDAK